MSRTRRDRNVAACARFPFPPSAIRRRHRYRPSHSRRARLRLLFRVVSLRVAFIFENIISKLRVGERAWHTHTHTPRAYCPVATPKRLVFFSFSFLLLFFCPRHRRLYSQILRSRVCGGWRERAGFCQFTHSTVMFRNFLENSHKSHDFDFGNNKSTLGLVVHRFLLCVRPNPVLFFSTEIILKSRPSDSRHSDASIFSRNVIFLFDV